MTLFLDGLISSSFIITLLDKRKSSRKNLIEIWTPGTKIRMRESIGSVGPTVTDKYENNM